MLQRIISGGQTGADRAALDFAIAHGIAHGGWCPKRRWTEDGPVPPTYLLEETPSSDPAQRTEWNVRDSDGTVIFSLGRTLHGGTLKTAEFADKSAKPCLHITAPEQKEGAAQKLVKFISEHRIRVLNVAGPRASEEPGIGKFTAEVLALAALTGRQDRCRRTPIGGSLP